MDFFSLENWWFSAFIAIILSILGSALWDLVKNSTRRWYNWIIYKTLIYNKKWRDRSFLEAARGLHEAAGLQVAKGYFSFKLIMLINFMVLYILFGILVVSFDNAAELREFFKNDIEYINYTDSMRNFFPVFVFLFIFASSYQILITIRKMVLIERSNNIITWIKQSLIIITPILIEKQKDKLLQAVALIRTEEDFLIIFSKIGELAAKSNLRLPEKRWEEF